MTGQRILMIVGDFGEDYEIMVPYQALQAVGHEVHAVCPEREGGETVKTAVHDFRGDQTYLETRGHDFELTHGPQILAAAGVLDGYEMTAYPAVRAEVEAAGCSWVDGVTTDGNLVTGQAWPDHPEWIAQFLDLLGTEIDHEQPAATAD